MKKEHRTKKPADVAFNFRLPKRDLKLIRKASEKLNVPVSAFIRDSIVLAAKQFTST